MELDVERAAAGSKKCGPTPGMGWGTARRPALERCLTSMECAFNFADNQVLRSTASSTCR
uniref:Uncharacterized protein n=1 Tax=Arundo donax TaxID=35708 RepID=A0A0A8ZTC7_ARUDO